MRPNVSVLIAAFNEEKYLASSVHSALAQHDVTLEVIIVDDQSTDRTAEIARELASSDPRVIVGSTKVKGKAAAFSEAFRLSGGMSIVLLGADDVLPEDSLRARYSRVSQRINGKAAAYGRLRTISEFRRFDGLESPKRGEKGNRSGGLGILTRPLADLCFPVPHDLPSEDAWLGLCAEDFAESTEFMDEIVLLYRIHENNSINRQANFARVRERHHQRRRASRMYLEAHGRTLTEARVGQLERSIQLESLSYRGKISSIICLKDISVREKAGAIAMASPMAYELKKIGARLLGRLY